MSCNFTRDNGEDPFKYHTTPLRLSPFVTSLVLACFFLMVYPHFSENFKSIPRKVREFSIRANEMGLKGS